jgi:hypothetical protein
MPAGGLPVIYPEEGNNLKVIAGGSVISLWALKIQCCVLRKISMRSRVCVSGAISVQLIEGDCMGKKRYSYPSDIKNIDKKCKLCTQFINIHKNKGIYDISIEME